MEETSELPEAPTPELIADPFEPIDDDRAGRPNAGAVIGLVLAVIAVVGACATLLLFAIGMMGTLFLMVLAFVNLWRYSELPALCPVPFRCDPRAQPVSPPASSISARTKIGAGTSRMPWLLRR